jgi:hypothetical protein
MEKTYLVILIVFVSVTLAEEDRNGKKNETYAITSKSSHPAAATNYICCQDYHVIIKRVRVSLEKNFVMKYFKCNFQPSVERIYPEILQMSLKTVCELQGSQFHHGKKSEKVSESFKSNSTK